MFGYPVLPTLTSPYKMALVGNAISVGVGGDTSNPFEPWFGPPNSYGRMDLDSTGGDPKVTHQLPLAYFGKSVAMASIILFKMIEQSEWYTNALLPWQQVEDLNITWTSFEFNKSFFEVAPPENNPSYIQSSVEAHSDKTIRRGMAFMIGHEFWKTDVGRQQYAMNLQVLQSSALITIYHMIIGAVLKAKNIYRNWELRYKNAAQTIPQALKRLKTRWAILNKGMDLFRKYHADAVEVMGDKGAVPTLWGFPPKTKILMTHTHQTETEYSSAGNLAIQARQKGQAAVDVIRGVAIYETDVFNEAVFGQEYNPLRRVRETGSFFWLKNYYEGAHLDTYRNCERFAAR